MDNCQIGDYKVICEDKYNRFHRYFVDIHLFEDYGDMDPNEVLQDYERLIDEDTQIRIVSLYTGIEFVYDYDYING